MAWIKSRPKPWDRFSNWAPGAAMLVLALALAVLVAAVLTERSAIYDAPAADVTAAPDVAAAPAGAPDEAQIQSSSRDTDLQLYDRIAQRVRGGENYYQVAVEEQRARDFPVRPGLAVRLPTLAFITAAIGQWGLFALGIVLVLSTLVAWHYRLRDAPGGPGRLRYILLLLLIGVVTGFKPQYLVLHEVWAGLLIALSLGLYRPNRWIWAFLAGVLALAIREHALPFILLMAVFAWARGNRGEAAAWLGAVLIFGALLLFHLSLVGQYTTAEDPASPGWMALRGFGGLTANIVLSSPLQYLPGWLAAPLALLPLIGWAGWRSWFGLTGFLLCLGYGVLFMIAGRDNNFYWALIVMPIWFVGYAFVPRALMSLWQSARGN
ncbi:hypothetical protein [Aurantiacibacter marinus]|uniref:DUF2029 domain-containing protein n=1 Tax=Aurantiacibacter marinus TaxID=874156 RepID=A0A0H0XR87_9SPHN|nr:hypothetical protein [Aurantiacibacter marinus]KLI64452.1 hypothetical protein AAV99_02305 [Aurantiacibacter marinus]